MTGVLRVRIGGAWVDVQSPGPPGPAGPQGPTGLSRLVAVGSLTSPSIGDGTWGNVTNTMNAFMTTGHWYRVTLTMRAIIAPATATVRTRLSINPSTPFGDTYITVIGNQFTNVHKAWLLNGDNASHAFVGMLMPNGCGTLTVYGDSDCMFICEDLGVISP